MELHDKQEHGYFIAKAAGTTMSPAQEAALLLHAVAANSDLLFADTIVIGADGEERSIAAGSFDQYTFMQQPFLGAAVAVRRGLAIELGVVRQDLLDGALLLKLVGASHTISHVGLPIATIGESDRAAAMPNRQQLQGYVDQAGGAARVDEHEPGFFTLDHAALGDRYKTAIIVIDRGDVTLEHAQHALDQLVTTVSRDHVKIHLGTIRPEVLPGRNDGRPIVQHPIGRTMSYGRIANLIAANCGQPKALVFMDAGIVPAGGADLDRLVGLLEDPAIGACAPVALYGDRRIRHAGLAWREDGLHYLQRFTRFDDSALPMIRAAPIISRHCFAIRSSLFAAIGGFDDRLEAQSADVDLCCRLELFGHRRLINVGAVVHAPDDAPRWRRRLQHDEWRFLTETYGNLLEEREEDKVGQTDAESAVAITTTFIPPRAGR